MKDSRPRFSWQALYLVRVGGVEVQASWQAQEIVKLHKSVLMFYKSVPQKKVSHKSFCTRVSHKSVSYKSVTQECLIQDFPTKVSRKSAPQECRTRVFHKSIPQEYSTRLSSKSAPSTRMSLLQECPTRASHKSTAYRVSDENAQGCQTMFRPLFSSACAHPSSWVPSCLLMD